MQATTTTNFNKQLGDVVRAAASRQAAVQTLVTFGCKYAAENAGNMLYVSQLVAKLLPIKGFRTGLLISYVKDTCAVEYTKAKDGNMVFKPLPENKRDGRPLVDTTKLSAPWYDFEKAKAKADKTAKTVDQLVSYLEKWAGADADAIDPTAKDLCAALLARAKLFKNELALKEINASNSEVETQAA